MFLDFSDFTSVSFNMAPDEIFAELKDIFSRFDEIIAEFNCERIKTIGDACLAVCGMPEHQGSNAEHMTSDALKSRD